MAGPEQQRMIDAVETLPISAPEMEVGVIGQRTGDGCFHLALAFAFGTAAGIETFKTQY